MTLAPEAIAAPVKDEVAAAASIGLASQRQLVWLKFKEHKLAYWSGVLIILIYLVGIFCEVVAPRSPDYYDPGYTMLAPQSLNLFYFDEAGQFHFQPHVNG